MLETNFKNWLFGLNLHNSPDVLYNLFKVLSEKQANEYFDVILNEQSLIIKDKARQSELFIEKATVAEFIHYLRENYCLGQNIEEWYKAKSVSLKRDFSEKQVKQIEEIRRREGYYIHPKERAYFIIMLIFTIIFLSAVGFIIFMLNAEWRKTIITLFIIYILFFSLLILLKKGFLIGILRGRAVKVSEKQFSNIYQLTNQIASQLGLPAPETYIIESGGLLNAFATRFMGNNFIILYSDMVEAGASKGNKSLPFIIGHELAHIKRRHLLKKTLLFPAYFVPFLGLAYSRACEFTCDKIGFTVSSPESAQHGLLLLAGGKSLYNQIDVNEYIKNYRLEAGFWTWFTEKFLTHPHLTKRIDKLFIS
jgi:Zn-dependent protease with chaperone function